MSATAIVPIKALSAAKARLAGALQPAKRRAFVEWMATRVLRACQSCDGIDDVLVVAGDHAAAEIGRRMQVRVLLVPQPGLDAALAAADACTAARPATIVVAADLPQATARDLEAVMAAGGAGGSIVVIAPTVDGGTGVLLRRPPTVVRTAYGRDSAAAHAALADAAGVPVVWVHRPGLAADVDTPEQLPAALALAAGEDVVCRPR